MKARVKVGSAFDKEIKDSLHYNLQCLCSPAAQVPSEELKARAAAERFRVQIVPFFQLEFGEQRLGQGGYGDVWAAEFSSEPVAVKMAKGSRDDSLTPEQKAEQDRKVQACAELSVHVFLDRILLCLLTSLPLRRSCQLWFALCRPWLSASSRRGFAWSCG